MPMTQTEVTRLLRQARDKGATEIHLKVPQRPSFRSGGLLLPTEHPPLGPNDTLQAALALCALARLELAVAALTDHEFGLGVPDVGRFRVQLYKQRGTVGIVIQRVTLKIPSLTELGIPQEADKVIGRPGLVLIGGGVRRHALMAALVETFNTRLRGYAVVIESPLSHLHRDAMATVAQREVAFDVGGFQSGIEHALRQHADLIGVGDVPDEATADAVMRAAEHGAAVLCCVTATGAKDTAWQLGRRFHPHFRKDYEKRLNAHLLAMLHVPDSGEAEYLPRFDPNVRPVSRMMPRAAASAALKR